MESDNKLEDESRKIWSNPIAIILTFIFLYLASIVPVAILLKKYNISKDDYISFVFQIVYFPIEWAMRNIELFNLLIKSVLRFFGI